MVENGRTNVPLARIADFIQAYELSPLLIMVFLKEIYPDVWAAFSSVFSALKDLDIKSVADIEEIAYKELKTLRKKFKI